MLRENIEDHIRRISPGGAGRSVSVCTFAPRSGIVGFIDTSGAHDGTRGIAFFGDRMFVNTDGRLHEIAYKNINSLHVISSFEDSFADEISVSANGTELRISDYSLDKFELKQLIDELCREQVQVAERHAEQAEKYAEIIAKKLADDAEDPEIGSMTKSSLDIENEPNVVVSELNDTIQIESEHPVIAETVVEIPEVRVISDEYEPAVIPEEKIDWISGGSRASMADLADDDEDLPISETELELKIDPEVESNAEVEEQPLCKPLEVMNGVIDRSPVIGTIKPHRLPSDNKPKKPAVPEPDNKELNKPELSEREIREQIENMSSDEMMAFLSDTINEINETDNIGEPYNEPLFEHTAPTRSQPDDDRQTEPSTGGGRAAVAVDEPKAPEKKPSRWEKLTVEPVWGDIYIKASQSLRELCEGGKLTMEQMEAELRERLVAAAESFESITSDDGRVPKVMIPKITELKAAAENFDHYFSYGEDIAIRAMFFMLYQMLTYADRISESPETKDRLNDFFRRFGSAGITLSMLDMRV
ncbi:MAG: hypothetical protein K2J80_10180 [Oscillospiraceae bacterium]|nr:hypothetical protein [Oscillospiraceae bacterium]